MHREIAKTIIDSEIEALKLLSDNLDDSFNKAVDLILSTKNHIITVGMGKSSFVAGKIAATMASTGTPAFFVHPGEASHGDLGMITTKNILIIISNSGETKEIMDVINYAKRYDIKTISITSNKNSTLGKNTTVCLQIPNVKEACPHNLAPTNSTTCSLALGDALAVAVYQYKSFTPEEFSNYHPGGKLGKSLLKVENIMHEDIPLVNENTSVPDSIIEMTAKSFGCVGIVSKKNKLIGIITDGQLRRNVFNDFINKNAKDIMTKTPICTKKNILAVQALKMMNDNKITQLFVVNNKNEPIGIIHIHDIIRGGI